MTYSSSMGKSFGIALAVVVLIIVVVFTIGRSINIGDVTGKPYSVKLTSTINFGTGDWVYYNEAGQEKPLNCERSFAHITCESENGELEFSATLGKRSAITFPSITVNGEKQSIQCANRLIGADCLTTMN